MRPFPEAAALTPSLSAGVMTSVRIDSETRFGMQPNGPMMITPATFVAISVMALPTVRTASLLNWGFR